MRLKGINPFEQHVEKGVVAAVAAVALGILAWQFVGPENTVTVKGKPVGLTEAYPLLEQEAKSLQTAIRNPEPPLADIPKLDMLARWETLTKTPQAPKSTIAWAGEGREAIAPVDQPIAGMSELRVAEFVPPPPAKPIAVTYLATIAPSELSDYPELAALIPNKQPPFDKAAVSVETTFDGTALRAMLAADPDGESGPLSKIPEFWWSNGIQILDVQLQREELQPTGEWSNLTLVDPMPGRASLRKDLASPALTGAAVRELIETADEIAPELCRPPYYQIVFGEDWLPPSKAILGAAAVDRGRIDYLLRIRDRLEQDIARVEEDLGKITGDDRTAEMRRRNIQARLDDLKRQLDRNAQDLRAAGYIFPDDPMTSQDPTAAPQETEATPLLADPAFQIWAHDLTAERGKTYRYRFVLALRNPLYGQRAAVHRDNQALTEKPVMLSAPSPWSDPVRVDPDLYFFITSAQDSAPGQGLNNGPRAAAEIYAFQWGYWRRGTVSLEPGDPLVGEVRFPDMAKVLADAQQPGANPDNSDNPRGSTKPEIPMKRITVGQDTFLLDVAAVPAIQEGITGAATGGMQYRAFFRDSSGRIVVRSPDTEKADPAYQRVVASALAGEEVLRPKEVRRNETERPFREGERGPAKPGGGKSPGKGGG